jgi:hypothetical protein
MISAGHAPTAWRWLPRTHERRNPTKSTAAAAQDARAKVESLVKRTERAWSAANEQVAWAAFLDCLAVPPQRRMDRDVMPFREPARVCGDERSPTAPRS